MRGSRNVSDAFRRGADWLGRRSAALSRAAAYTASFLVAAPFLYHLANGSTAYLGLLEDDYFYYAIIADKLVTLGRLTYDGTTLTNGFHPLWFGVLVALRAAFGRFGPAFYVALTAVSVASMIVTYELGRRFARELGASASFAPAAAAIYSVGTAQLLIIGMEAVLAVPLCLWLLLEVARGSSPTPRHAARLGAIASLAILARLDLALAVALLIVGFVLLVRPPLATFRRLLGAFCAGGFLVPLYAAANLVFFGSPFPISMLAKGLWTGAGFNIKYAQIVALGTVYGPTIALVLPLGLIALCLLLRSDARPRPAARFAGGLTLVFAFAFFGLNALSGWTFFGWYAYPIATAVLAALVFIAEWGAPLLRSAPARAIAVACLVALAPALAARYYLEHGPRWSISDNTLLAMSYDLADRLQGREGLFAMGAVAGMATYALDKPVLQLEGIVADRRLVEHIRHEDSLDAVLREYRVNYLIVTLANVRAELVDGCYLITQPNAEWAGERTAKMRGEICAEPVEHFVTPKGANAWSRFPATETLVWDLRGAGWGPRRRDAPEDE
jgi:hypothetical protein